MMNNVNIPLALFTIFLRRFIDKLRTPHSNVILKHTAWYRNLTYLRPCMYMYMVGAGLYYTYKHLQQRPNFVPLSRKHSRIHRMRENSISRRRFSDRNKIWFLKSLSAGSKRRESALRMLSSQLTGSGANLDTFISRRNSPERNYRNYPRPPLSVVSQEEGSLSRRNSEISMTISTDLDQEIEPKIGNDNKSQNKSGMRPNSQEFSGIDLSKFSNTMKLNESINKDIMDRRVKLFEENLLAQGDREFHNETGTIEDATIVSKPIARTKRNRKCRFSRKRKITRTKFRKGKQVTTKPEDDVSFVKKTRSGRVYGYSELDLQLNVH